MALLYNSKGYADKNFSATRLCWSKAILFGTNFASGAYGVRVHWRLVIGHISLGEGNTYGLLPACSGDGTRPARLAVLSPPGAAVRPSAYGRHRAGSSRQPAVILRSVRDRAALVLFQPDGDELAGAATDDHLGAGARAVRHPADLAGGAQ